MSIIHARFGLGVLAVWAIASPIVNLPGSVGEWLFHPQNVQFGFGILASWLFVVRRWPSGLVAWALLAAGAERLLYLGYLRHSSHRTNTQLAIPLGFCGLLVVTSAAHEITRVSRLLAFLGSASYSIYLIHFLFIPMFNKVLSQLPFLANEIALLLLTGFATLAGCIYYLLFEVRLERLPERRKSPYSSSAGQSGSGDL